MEPHYSKKPIVKYLFLLTFAQAAAFAGWNILYTNFAVEIAQFNGFQNGIVQGIRELPGLLSVGVILCLLFLTEIKLTSLAVLLCGIGVACTGFFPSFSGQLFWTLILSFGFHYFEATNQSLTLQYFNVTQAPHVMGLLRSATAIASFIMCAIILALSTVASYPTMFIIAGSIAIVIALWSFTQNPVEKGLVIQRKGLVLKKQYWLYYSLTFLSGARRQIFTVFSSFLLVKTLGFSLTQISLLLLISNLINAIINRQIGKAINYFGERSLLTCKYCILICIFSTYVYSTSPILIGALYILEQILFNFTATIRTFFQKIAQKEDIAPSMSVGVTINHIAAVVVPIVGGAVWLYDYRIPFIMGIAFAIVSLIMTQLISKQLALHHQHKE